MKVRIPDEYLKSIEHSEAEGKNTIEFGYVDPFTYQLYFADDRPINVRKLIGVECVLEKGEILLPPVITENYKCHCDTDHVFLEEDGQLFIHFFRLA